MDNKKNGLLSNVIQKLGGEEYDPYKVSDESWERLQQDEDMDVLRLDDDIPSSPAAGTRSNVELTLGEGTPDPDEEIFVKPELTLEPGLEPDPEPAPEVKPQLIPQAKPELTLEPELEIKPELTLEPGTVQQPGESAGTESVSGTGSAGVTPEAEADPDADMKIASGRKRPLVEWSEEVTSFIPRKPAAGSAAPADTPSPSEGAASGPAEEDILSVSQDSDDVDQYTDEMPESSAKSGHRWQLPPMPSFLAGLKKDREKEIPDEDFDTGSSTAPAGPEPETGSGIPGAWSNTPGSAAYGGGTAAPSGSTPEEPSQPEPEVELPEDEDYEFDDEGSGTAKAILGSAGSMAAGIGAGLLSILKVIGSFLRDAFLSLFAGAGAYLKHEFRPKNIRNLFSRYLLAFVIIYYEFVLKFSTTGKPLGFAILYIILFSVCWGLVGYLLTTILRPPVNRNARKVLILVLALPYLINYFHYKQTGMLLGLSDTWPVTAKSMFSVVFSLPGLAHIALFLIPFLLYSFLLCYVDKAKRIKTRRRLRTVFMILALWFVTWLLVLANGNYRWAYSKEYNYETAVSSFGLLNTMRLDALMKIRGNTGRPASLAPEEEESEELEDESGLYETEEETEEYDDGFVDPLEEQELQGEDSGLEEEEEETEEMEEEESQEEDGDQPMV